jgi:hypothetical protein
MAREPRRHSWSLKSRLAVLGTLAAASVAVAAFLTFQMLRQTESAVIGDAARQLAVAGDQMANRYHYLSASFLQRDVPSPLAASEEILLTQLTEAGLAGYQGSREVFISPLVILLLATLIRLIKGPGRRRMYPLRRKRRFAVWRGVPLAKEKSSQSKPMRLEMSSCFTPALL